MVIGKAENRLNHMDYNLIMPLGNKYEKEMDIGVKSVLGIKTNYLKK
jgi:hypothetical protein